jgi:hypothetical protein
MYDNGLGVPQDDELAYCWLNLAATAPGAEDKVRKLAVEACDSVDQRLTPKQRADAQKKSREWFEQFQAKKKGQGRSPSP